MKQFFVFIEDINEDEPYCRAIECTKHIGTSNYDHFLEGLYRKVDLEKYYVDSDMADAEHERRMRKRQSDA